MSEDEKDDYICLLERRNQELTALFVALIERIASIVQYLAILAQSKDQAPIHMRWLREQFAEVLHELDHHISGENSYAIARPPERPSHNPTEGGTRTTIGPQTL